MNFSKKIATAAAVAVAGLGLAVSSASADISLTPANTNFTGHNTGAHTFTAGQFTVSCTTATFTGNTGSGPRTRVPFHADYSGCDVIIAGDTLPADVTTNSNWDLHHISGVPPAAVTTRVDVTASTVPGQPPVRIDIPDLDCVIDVAVQSGLNEVIANNIASPTQVRLVANVPAVPYTTDCPGIPASGSAGYAGTVDIPGITMN